MVVTRLHEDSPPLEWALANEAMSNYSFLFPWEKWPVRIGDTYWLNENWTISLWGFAIYVLMVHIGQWYMSKRDAFDLRMPCVVWNACAAVFSILGFWRSSYEVLRVLNRHGWVHSCCISSWVQDAVFCFWIKAFIVSKFFEFIDTGFLILRKRKVTFLHWYHHGTVLVFCWHGASTLTAAGRWFSWMNYGVHMVIYSYFALRTYGFGTPKWLSMCVTGVQMSQMVAGVFIGYTVYTVKSSGGECHQLWSNVWMAFGIYTTFFLLFAHYFYVNYVRPGGGKRKAAAATTTAAHHSKRKSEIAASNGVGKSKMMENSQDGQVRNRRSAYSEAG